MGMKARPSLKVVRLVEGSKAQEVLDGMSLEASAPILEAKNKLATWNGIGAAYASEIALKLAIWLGKDNER